MAEKINPKKFNNRFQHSETHRIDYTIYKGETVLLSEFNKAKNKRTFTKAACFGSMLSHMRESGRYNVKYDVIRDPNATHDGFIPILEPIEVKKWFQITRKYRLLPKSIRFFSKNTSQYIILNMKEWPISLSYMFLVIFRYVREDPGLVRAFVHLVDEVGIDPYAAFVAVHKCCTGTVGHSVLRQVRDYMGTTMDKAKFDLAIARRVRKFVNDPWRYDDRDITKQHPYNLQNTIDSVSAGIRDTNTAEIPVKKITHPKITPFVYEEDPDMAAELYKEIVDD